MEPASQIAPDNATSAAIVCPVTRWYYRRMGMLAGLLLVFGLVFLYDGVRGYPQAVEIAKKKAWFTTEFLPSFDTAKKAGQLEQWLADAKAKGLPTGTEGEPPRWVSYAAANGWEENPKPYSDREIAEQFWCAYACLAGVFVVGVLVLLSRSKVLRGEADHWVTPTGVRINYADVFRVDKRKWEHKGLAYAWYRTQGMAAQRAVIDDLKYAGADQILARLLSRFNGELIEKISAPETAAEQPAAPRQ